MSFNVWGVDNQTSKLAEIIWAGGADIVGLQEMDDISGWALATALGFHCHQQSGNDVQVLSRYAIVGQSADNRGANIEITPGHNIWLFNSHVTPYPYQPYDLRDNPNLSEAQLIASAESTRGAQVNADLNSINNTA